MCSASAAKGLAPAGQGTDTGWTRGGQKTADMESDAVLLLWIFSGSGTGLKLR